MPRKAPRSDSVLRALADQLRGSVTAGAEWRGELVEGDLVAEVTVRVRRRVTQDAARGYREQALEALTKDPIAVRRCGCYVQRRKPWGGTSSDRCSGRVVSAVAYRPSSFPTTLINGFQFVCSRHTEKHGLRPESVFAIVALPEHALRPLRKQAEEVVRQREAEWRAEDAKREAEREKREQAKRDMAAHASDPLGYDAARKAAELNGRKS